MGRHQAACTHHWVLTETNMRDIQGDCRRCGAHKIYPGSLEYVPPMTAEEELDRNRQLLATDAASLEHSLAY